MVPLDSRGTKAPPRQELLAKHVIDWRRYDNYQLD
jgi:hypothetical protein